MKAVATAVQFLRIVKRCDISMSAIPAFANPDVSIQVDASRLTVVIGIDESLSPDPGLREYGHDAMDYFVEP